MLSQSFDVKNQFPINPINAQTVSKPAIQMHGTAEKISKKGKVIIETTYKV